MKVLAITQARVGSTRLPKKVLKEIKGQSLLDLHLERINESREIDQLIVATTWEEGHQSIEDIGRNRGAYVYKGSLDDVLDRFYQAASKFDADWIVRLTSDCPLIDAKLIDKVILKAKERDLDYVSNNIDPKFPDGQDIEVIKFSALKKAWNEAKLKSDREHVTPYIWRNSSYKGGELFSSMSFDHDVDYSHHRITVDTIEDFNMVKGLIELAGTKRDWIDYVKLLEDNPALRAVNSQYERNEGYAKSLKED